MDIGKFFRPEMIALFVVVGLFALIVSQVTIFLLRLLRLRGGSDLGNEVHKAWIETVRERYRDTQVELQEEKADDGYNATVCVTVKKSDDPEKVVEHIRRDICHWFDIRGLECRKVQTVIIAEDKQYSAVQKLYLELLVNNKRLQILQDTGCEFDLLHKDKS